MNNNGKRTLVSKREDGALFCLKISWSFYIKIDLLHLFTQLEMLEDHLLFSSVVTPTHLTEFTLVGKLLLLKEDFDVQEDRHKVN